MDSTPRRAIDYLRRESIRDIFHHERKKVWNVFPLPWRVAVRQWRYARNHPKEAIANPLDIRLIDPSDIVYDGPVFNRIRCIGHILDGEWDEERVRLESLPIYQGLRERFVDGLPWRETIYWSLAKKQFEKRGRFLGYHSLEQFSAKRLPYIDELYESISTQGYRRQGLLTDSDDDLHRHSKSSKAHSLTHEVGVNIARDGEVLLNSGIHRLSLAQFIGIEEIPVLVVVRHLEWQQTRNDIHQGNINSYNHLDLNDLMAAGIE